MKPLSRKITLKMFAIYVILYLGTLSILFLLVRPRLEKEAEKSASNTLALMSGELDNVQDIITEYSNSILYSDTIISGLKSYDAEPTEAHEALVNQSLSQFVVANSFILTASLEDIDHQYFQANYFDYVSNEEAAKASPAYQLLKEKGYGSYFSYISPEEFAPPDWDTRYHVMEYGRVITLNKKSYILRIFANLSKAFRHMEILAVQYFSDTAILYSDGTPAFLSGNTFVQNQESLGELFPYHLSSDMLRTRAGVYFYEKDITTGWILLVFSPYYLYDRVLVQISVIVSIVYVLSAIIYTIFLVMTIRRSLLPLEQLNKAMKDYSAGEKVSTDIHTGDEIEKLNGYFIEMTEKINRQVDDIREQEHINSVVNYKLLATQIDPHFIYNTMNIINIMAREKNTEAVLEINSALIKILRERLNTKLSITDTVENERDTLYQYSRIMSYRYEDRVQLTLDVDNELLGYQIPKNILQPLAENSFYHGFPSLEEGQAGHIDIMIYTVDNELVIEISDDGAGISPERLEMLRSRTYEIYNDKKPHIGLDNIQQRLAFMYPNRYQFDIQSREGCGTTISISFPAVK